MLEHYNCFVYLFISFLHKAFMYTGLTRQLLAPAQAGRQAVCFVQPRDFGSHSSQNIPQQISHLSDRTRPLFSLASLALPPGLSGCLQRPAPRGFSVVCDKMCGIYVCVCVCVTHNSSRVICRFPAAVPDELRYQSAEEVSVEAFQRHVLLGPES